MNRLVLEYVFEGHQRGYNFTSPTRQFSDAILKAIWRTAMPRGQGWGGYQGAQSLKTFGLEGGGVAVADVTVTDQRDESGRAGIRRAVIDVMPRDKYHEFLQQRWQGYHPAVRTHAEQRFTAGLRARIIDRAARDAQIVFAGSYSKPES
ncbi:MAG: hypothetical protein K8I30_16335, partial [Anaerolineae bacterium]|nr:hypothetical protein [Anaerolineae bacterium]